MKKIFIYFLYVIFFCIFLTIDVSAQSRSSASIDIRIKIVNSISTSLATNGILEDVNSKIVESLKQDREVLIHYGNRSAQKKVKKIENKQKSDILSVFNRFNNNIGTAEIHNFTTIQNISKTDKLQFVPSFVPKEDEYYFAPSITIVY